MPDGHANADSERMQVLLRRFELPLLQFATRITGDRERARDVVQETFVKFQNNGVFQNPEPATWLFTVCQNGALNVCRKERRMQYLDEEIIEACEAEQQPMPFERLEQKEAAGFLMRLRYKKPDGNESELMERAVIDEGKQFANASPDFKFAAAVAEFGMLLRDSKFKGNGTLGAVLKWAEEGKGADLKGYRAGFLELVRKAQALKRG